jgi:hypothetical protein
MLALPAAQTAIARLRSACSMEGPVGTLPPSLFEVNTMTLCPIALAVGCKKCPAFSACPLKSVIGDVKKPDADAEKPQASKDSKKK